MVQRIFKVRRDGDSPNGWKIEDTSSGTELNLPEIVYDDLDTGKYLNAEEILEKIDTMQIALAGVTDSLRVVEPRYLDRNSVLKTFGLKSTNTIDDSIEEYIESVRDYEKYHTIEMGRDVAGNDNSIHAYIETPKDGRLRCQFDKSVRLDAKRNNIKYWIDDYSIASGSSGGKFVRLKGDPVEIV